MPDKLLKDGLRTSAKIGAVSAFAELLFIRLILATCPHGRCPWSPDWILANALPNRPHTRLHTIAAALSELLAACLVSRYEHDGTAFLTIPNHGQRFKYAARSPWPAPRGGAPDSEGQTFMALPDAAASPPADRRRPKASVPCATLHFSSSSGSDSGPRARDLRLAEDCADELTRRFPRHDIRAQLRAARNYVRKQRGEDAEVTIGWFIVHWMPNAAERKPDHSGGAVALMSSAAIAEREAAGARWAAEQAAKIAELVAGPEPVRGTLDHAIWLEGRKSA